MVRRPGNPGKGSRRAITVRVPEEHKHAYEAAAAEHGLPLSDYLALELARRFDLGEPEYLQKVKGQEQLPMGA